jgi:hypothetical protein
MMVPHYVGENKSDIRAVKCGWYAIDDIGNLVVGPFFSREMCVEGIIQRNDEWTT